MWLSMSAAVIAGVFASGGVAQVREANKVYAEADPIAGAIDGLLACRVDVAGSRGWDTFSAIDLAVTLSAGDVRVEMWGEEDRSSTFVTAARVQIALGTRVVVVVEDRDVTEREPVGQGAQVFDGKSLAFDLGDTLVSCRVVPNARAERRAGHALAQARGVFTRLRAPAVNLQELDLGWDRGAEFEMDVALQQAVAWAGPSADQQALLDERLAAHQAFLGRVREAVKRQPSSTFRSDRHVEVALTEAGVELAPRVAGAGYVSINVIDESGVVRFVDTRGLTLPPPGTTTVVPVARTPGAIVRVSVGIGAPLLLKD